VADCLPVLLADRAGRAVAAAHAGWRGLAGGVIEAALQALCDAAGTRPEAVEVWLGPCIGPRAFEVGADVWRAFADAPEACFVPCNDAARTAAAGAAPEGLGLDVGPVSGPATSGPKWWADLPALARWRLARAGVREVQGNDGTPAWCTVENPAWFSYRRERGRTGRQAAFIGLRDLA
jgi:YfiH family protein